MIRPPVWCCTSDWTARFLSVGVQSNNSRKSHERGVDGTFVFVQEHVEDPAAKGTSKEGCDHGNLVRVS
jgi:hypothetical protein